MDRSTSPNRRRSPSPPLISSRNLTGAVQEYGERVNTPGRHSTSRILKKRLENLHPDDEFPAAFVPDLIPNARLGSEVPFADNTSLLGSTQLSGCQGDFCEYSADNWRNITSADLNKLKRSNRNGELGYHRVMQSAGLLDEIDRPSADQNRPSKRITYRSILLARQQIPVVNMILAAHMAGEESSNLALNDDFTDIAVAGKVPAHYYQEVPCCSNCYRIYTILDQRRSKAMQQGHKNNQALIKGHTASIYSSEDQDIMGEGAKDYLESNLTKFQMDQLNNKGRKGRNTINNGTAGSNDNHKQQMTVAREAIEGLSKLDVAEIRSMQKPPAAVEVVMEAVMILLTGKYMTFKESYRLLSGGESFLTMLREFNLSDVTDKRLQMIELYVDNPLFRPENVLPVSNCAAKFCAWVLAIVNAARRKRGLGDRVIYNASTNTSQSLPKGSIENESNKKQKLDKSYMKPSRANNTNVDMNQGILGPNRAVTPNNLLGNNRGEKRVGSAEEELSFVQKLEKMKANKAIAPVTPKKVLGSSLDQPSSILKKDNISKDKYFSKSLSKFDPGPTPTLLELSLTSDKNNSTESTTVTKKLSKRETKAMKAMQSKTTNRLAAQTAMEGSVGVFGIPKTYRCFDNVTTMPYIVMGSFSMEVQCCNFVVIHDIFDTYDATAILLKPIIQKHQEGCQILCFNYPGQAHTTWPRPVHTSSSTSQHSLYRDCVLNNDWIADKLHEMLGYAEDEGDILLARPFHLVGMGNGVAIAAAFCQKYANHELYRNSLRSMVSINGFLYPDPQYSSVLHAAKQVFQNIPNNRYDIASSYWSRFIFSEDYLSKVNPNLALNIYTAVTNPITIEGRVELTKGCLAHKDLRGSFSPEPIVLKSNKTSGSNLGPVQQQYKFNPIQVPLIALQSTDNTLIHASNVDSMLIGRTSKHLWSHMLNITNDPEHSIVSMSIGSSNVTISAEDYHKYSILGKNGLKMLLDSLSNTKGAFVMWVPSGHQVQQENKNSLLDLIDALTCPTEDYFGLATLLEREEEQKRKEKEQLQLTMHDEEKEALIEISASNTLPVTSTPSKSTKANTSNDIKIYDTMDVTTSFIKDLEESIPEPINVHQAIEDILKNVHLKKDDDNATSNDFTDTINNDNEGIELSDDKELLDEYQPTNTFSSPSRQTSDNIRSTQSSPGKELREDHSSSKKIRFVDEPAAFRPSDKKDDFRPSAVKMQESLSLELNKAETFIAGPKQKSQKRWLEDKKEIPTMTDSLLKEAELQAKENEYLEAVKVQATQEEVNVKKSTNNPIIDELRDEIEQRQKERDFVEKQRRLRLQEIEDRLMKEGHLPTNEEKKKEEPVKEMPPMKYTEPAALPKAITDSRDILSQLDQMTKDEEEAHKRGQLSVHDFEKIKRQMMERQLERDQKLRALSTEELAHLQNTSVTSIQRIQRGISARKRAKKLDDIRQLERQQRQRILQIQKIVRGFLGRRKFKKIKFIYLANMKGSHSATQIQRTYRGFAGRARFRRILRIKSAALIQRVFRGMLGRIAFQRERKKLELMKRRHSAAAKIQSIWRMKVCHEEYRCLRINILAAIEIQRCYRGYLGRKKMQRRRLWENAKPGPERIKLGMQFIEESKQAFERQQEEIDALHRAQKRAEARISHIHAELKDSEKELVVLEREMQEIDQIERDLQVLTHERQLLTQGIEDAAGMPRLAAKGHDDLVLGKESNHSNDPMVDRKRRAEIYALEMTIQLKRAEREKRRQELEMEFAAVFKEVDKKRKALTRLEASIVDMESTRERKEREFQRLKQNLTQLLFEQKQELDEIRQKGIELETATATTAAAAVATAQKAKEHEQRSQVMFSQTEELMKFQFMSMSLSYFSSLNMLKSLREMNADTSSAAIALSADASATAASAAAAANLPKIKEMSLGGNDFVESSIKKKKDELSALKKAEEEIKNAPDIYLPSNVKSWSVHDVSRWLNSLSLSQYIPAFLEGSVDGPFLLELREEDLVQVLGISHKLHVRKILISREKLKPLNQQEMLKKEAVEREDKADAVRGEMGLPSLDTVFSQARNGRIKRVEESINQGFPVDSEDENGNTLLLVSSQNSNKRMAEMLILRGASVNHQNAQGNTALHYALAFDPEGVLGEYLIEHGADDTIENVQGLTPYDGLAT